MIHSFIVDPFFYPFFYARPRNPAVDMIQQRQRGTLICSRDGKYVLLQVVKEGLKV